MECVHDGCVSIAEKEKRECYRHRLLSVGIVYHGGAHPGRNSWNQSRNDFMMENFGTTDDRELGKQGIERA